MNQTLLNEVKATILNLEIPKSKEEFGGAGLVVTQDPTWTGRDGDVIVLTQYAAEISWLLFQLKEVYDYKLDYMGLGEVANQAIEEGKDLRGILTSVVTIAEAKGRAMQKTSKRKIKQRIPLADGWYFNITLFQEPGGDKFDEMYIDNPKA